MTALLALDRVAKRYGAVRAVEGVSLEIEPGAIHAVAGENGAGKSTLLKMAAGIVVPDAGRVLVGGQPLEPHTAREALARGVAMVEQHFALVGALTALENVMLGAEPVRSFGRLDAQRARARAGDVARSIGVAIDWDARVDTLGVGDRQRLELVRALVRDARVLILDEPTAVLTPREAASLYVTLRRLAGAGRAIVVVTHHLDEVREHADRVTVLRSGVLVGTRVLVRRDLEELDAVVRDVMGDDPPPAPERRRRTAGDVALRVAGLSLGHALRGVSFEVRAGEIVGIAGVEGNGQRELVRVIAGLERAGEGSVTARGAAVVHEDRHAEGLVLDAAVRDNLVLGELGLFSRWGWVDGAALEQEARTRLERGHVVPPELALPARALSGGNQQKLVVARAVARAASASVFVFAQPTRGVDLGAARAIHTQIAGLADQGKAVVVVSSDLGELRLLADRILVLARGRVVADLPPDAPDARIGDAMLGASAQPRPCS
jgi:simple sugar transport system ATP-binding protein